jgi:hypothetical protein
LKRKPAERASYEDPSVRCDRKVEPGVHVQAEPAVGVDVRPKQRAQRASILCTQQLVPAGAVEDVLQQGVDVHQRGLQQVQDEHGDRSVLAVRAGEITVCAIERCWTRSKPGNQGRWRRGGFYLDALVVKVRDGHQVRNKHAHIAVGVDLDGVKHVLGIWVHASEGAKFWAGGRRVRVYGFAVAFAVCNGHDLVVSNRCGRVPSTPSALLWSSYRPRCGLRSPSGLRSRDHYESVFLLSAGFASTAIIAGIAAARRRIAVHHAAKQTSHADGQIKEGTDRTEGSAAFGLWCRIDRDQSEGRIKKCKPYACYQESSEDPLN